MNTASLIDVPVGAVPYYEDFKRHVWNYAAADHVTGPPWVYSVLLQNDREYAACANVIDETIALGVNGARFRVREDPYERQVMREVMFADLEALHVVLQIIASRSNDLVLRGLGEFMMFTLGYRWV